MEGVLALIFGIVAVLLFVGLPVLIFAFSVRGLSNWSTQRQMPVVDVQATLVDKSASVNSYGGYYYYHHLGRYPMVPRTYTYTTYYLTFETDYGQRLTFAAGADVASQLVLGDTGLLQYKGQRLLNFHRALPAPQDSYEPYDGPRYQNPNW